jgi:hypothetical protein
MVMFKVNIRLPVVKFIRLTCEKYIEGHPKITGGIDPLHWLPEELSW